MPHPSRLHRSAISLRVAYRIASTIHTHYGGFATCRVLRAEPDYTLTITNAGYGAPYLKGAEVQIFNGLPLGLAGESSCSEITLESRCRAECHFSLLFADQLKIVSHLAGPTGWQAVCASIATFQRGDALHVLGTGVDGGAAAQTVAVQYTDGSVSTLLRHG
jgi:hypothetical protein